MSKENNLRTLNTLTAHQEPDLDTVHQFRDQTLSFEEPGPNTSADEDGTDLPQLVPGRPLRVAEMFSGPGGIGHALNMTSSEHFSFEHVWATDRDADTAQT